MRMFLIILAVIALPILARLTFYTVDAGEFAYVTVLGRHVETFDGGGGGAGLHVGWPWPVQVVQRLDRRVQQFDLAPTEHLTSDEKDKTVDKTLSVRVYVVWRIGEKEAVDRFVRSIGTPERARQILESHITGKVGAFFSKMKMNEIVNVEPGVVDRAMGDWHKKLLVSLHDQAEKDYGIDILDIRLRRFGYAGETQKAIFDKIKSERQAKAAEYEAEGKRLAQNIESKADEEYRTKLAEAKLEAAKKMGEADTESMRIRNDAHSKDKEFYAFMKKMEKLNTILGDNRTILLLSTNKERELFELLFQPPRPANTPGDKGGKQ